MNALRLARWPVVAEINSWRSLFLLPWDTVRIAVLMLSVWGVVWMLGYLAGARRD